MKVRILNKKTGNFLTDWMIWEKAVSFIKKFKGTNLEKFVQLIDEEDNILKHSY